MKSPTKRVFSIKGNFANDEKRIFIFDTFAEILKNLSLLHDRYWVTSEEKQMDLEDIRHFFGALQSDHEGFGIYILDENKIFTDQLISFRSRDRNFTLGFLASDLQAPDIFMNLLNSRVSISNAVCYLQQYAISFQKDHFRPPNSNLFEAPGLTNGRDGYTEGVSAEMWLGEPFWQYSKCSKEDLLSKSWLHCEERSSHLYVRAWPEPFSSAKGEQGERQRNLLDLLFGINNEAAQPLPAPPSTFVQKVLVEGDKLRDLGLAELQPDGSRVPLTPTEPSPAS